jgi:3',5'-cyclic AMP phosphodiesterase CpdA
MPRVAWATDIHLNFVDEARASAFIARLRATAADTFLIGGDIAEAPSVEGWLRRFDEELRAPVCFVLGNHDYYLGSIAELRSRMAVFPRFSSRLCWLTGGGIVALSEKTCLLGHDGWGDGRAGNAATSPVQLNDFVHIAELADLPAQVRRLALQRLGDAAAAHVDAHLAEALDRFEQVIVLTHVPPFREACRWDGHPGDDDWLPFFTCQALGDVLYRAMLVRPERRMTVLCGHTHTEAVVRPLPNLLVRTGAAAYGDPCVQGVFQVR